MLHPGPNHSLHLAALPHSLPTHSPSPHQLAATTHPERLSSSPPQIIWFLLSTWDPTKELPVFIQPDLFFKCRSHDQWCLRLGLSNPLNPGTIRLLLDKWRHAFFENKRSLFVLKCFKMRRLGLHLRLRWGPCSGRRGGGEGRRGERRRGEGIHAKQD